MGIMEFFAKWFPTPIVLRGGIRTTVGNGTIITEIIIGTEMMTSTGGIVTGIPLLILTKEGNIVVISFTMVEALPLHDPLIKTGRESLRQTQS